MSVDQLRDMLSSCRRAVVFTGAGISTESGIPDFRSPGGLWTKYKPVYFDDFMRSEEMRRETWRRKFAMEGTFSQAKPNRGHQAVAQLVHRGIVSSVITQNVDNLHQDAGVPDDKVIELHGNSSYATCLDCGTRYEMPPIREAFLRDETLPICDRCGGIVKTATISFGQSMPVEAMRRAEDETLACDLFLAIGSSLVVYPAAGFLSVAKQNGAKLVILNREATELDALADLVLNEEIGPALSAATGLN
ncbi:MAG TPA: NAD-dependent deacetylase [Alphaproteobacteria bacterium]|nr:NAD-dependent deacetylase [Alphaproteobacteria bacterium]HBF99501.1 NAD-dependent deacetylase [Alphaproteobacteria bacterium]HCO90744.1 NAD-dependent deacetylase [Alphaproteobacteria bacterium]